MKCRQIEPKILKYAKEYPILALVGPRQSGKTTLAQKLFPDHTYVSLENIDYRRQAIDDPRRFLNDWGTNLILDEVQRAPDLFSYLQERVDRDPTPGQYILTGSHQFLLFEGITQSLAGRICTFKLFPFTYTELMGYAKVEEIDEVYQKVHSRRSKVSPEELYGLLFTGLYPRIYDQHLDSRKWVEGYVLTYIERDVRSLVNIRNIRLFENFLKICASLSGQLINYASLSNTVGVSQTTIKEWLSLLETSGIIFILPPHFRNFSKRIVKTPKLYFVDTGILCYLLGIREPGQLKQHPLYGSIFETFVVSECFKRMFHLGEVPPLYFWRDQTGHEIDLLIDLGTQLFPVEIKSAQTFHKSFLEEIAFWMRLKENKAERGLVCYNGERIVGSEEKVPTVPWFYL